MSSHLFDTKGKYCKFPNRIPTDCELSLCELTDEYDIEKTLAEGYYAKIFLTNHKPTKSNVVLKGNTICSFLNIFLNIFVFRSMSR